VKPLLPGVVCTAGIVAFGNASHAQVTAARATTIEWGAYAQDAAGTKHSPAAQITRTNVKQLVPV